ncbi:MAG: 50S ribosomal protein L17 [Chloroflexi bacterium RBG_13_54_8]|nr:MAG: 50S ribosomal protein L17 [Chloroflexi bacterium RBG_13_54_8]
MRHRVAGRKLSRPTGHRLSMYFNLAAELLRHESIMTTEAKAKEARIMTDKMITLGKSGGLHSRRQALALLGDKKVVEKVFGELATRYANRSGGYTRVLKSGSRRGDGASMALLELVR